MIAISVVNQNIVLNSHDTNMVSPFNVCFPNENFFLCFHVFMFLCCSLIFNVFYDVVNVMGHS